MKNVTSYNNERLYIEKEKSSNFPAKDISVDISVFLIRIYVYAVDNNFLKFKFLKKFCTQKRCLKQNILTLFNQSYVISRKELIKFGILLSW